MIRSEAQRDQPSYVECPPFEDLEPVLVELAGAEILQLSGQPISAELIASQCPGKIPRP
jgi:hypothetical protein